MICLKVYCLPRHAAVSFNRFMIAPTTTLFPSGDNRYFPTAIFSKYFRWFSLFSMKSGKSTESTIGTRNSSTTPHGPKNPGSVVREPHHLRPFSTLAPGLLKQPRLIQAPAQKRSQGKDPCVQRTHGEIPPCTTGSQGKTPVYPSNPDPGGLVCKA